jgi:NADPH-dependent curcumin reductase CurA
MRGTVVGRVVGSKSAKYPVGSYVYAASGWTELAVADDSDKDMAKVELPKGGRLTDSLGVLGRSGCFVAFPDRASFRWVGGKQRLGRVWMIGEHEAEDIG